MLKKIIGIVRKIIFGFLFIYAFNKLAVPLNILIPMNFITVGLISMLGIPAVLMLVMFLFIYVR